VWAQEQPEILALYLYGSQSEGRANSLSDVDIGILVNPEISKSRLWRLEDQWLVQWPDSIDLRVLNFAPLPFRYEVTARGQRLWAADESAVATIESLIWRQYWDFRPKLEQDWEQYVEQVMEQQDETERHHACVKQRLQKLEQYINELEKQQQITLEKFRIDFTRQLAVERAFQAAIEGCTDIAAHIVSIYQLGHPEESRDVFHFLVEAGYLDHDFGQAMMAMVGFRNRLVHLYWDVDVEKLYQYLQEDVQLLRQFRDFTLQIITAEQDTEW
jgi:uncharacterized protein YutE (UPF0331/DUF86 family)/predicted nucleotidyltransferase